MASGARCRQECPCCDCRRRPHPWPHLRCVRLGLLVRQLRQRLRDKLLQHANAGQYRLERLRQAGDQRSSMVLVCLVCGPHGPQSITDPASAYTLPPFRHCERYLFCPQCVPHSRHFLHSPTALHAGAQPSHAFSHSENTFPAGSLTRIAFIGVHTRTITQLNHQPTNRYLAWHPPPGSCP